MSTSVSSLIGKYDIPAPRYTSYPTVPYWENDPNPQEWMHSVAGALQRPDAAWAAYIHVPFCETLCSFCGCNTSISRNHDIEDPYVTDVLREFDHYRQNVPELDKAPLKEIHFGGGSPTFLSAGNLARVVEALTSRGVIADEHEFSIEIDPRRARADQLQTLYDLGFRRVSLGVQDFDPEVQRLINRNQPYSDTVRVSELARSIGYTSVNFDLVYGLPAQYLETIRDTVKRTIALRPDRIALYSYAHVPWIKGAQRLFTEADLPSGPDKRALYELAREMLLEAGYQEVGMDHFALEQDPLWQSALQGTLHRNFMGYTSRRTELLLGLGSSAISDSWDCFHQTNKVSRKYQKEIQDTGHSTLRGHKLNAEDLELRGYILDVACRLKTRLPDDLYADVQDCLSEMAADGLVQFEDNWLIVTESGRAFLRNVCMGLDLRMRRNKPEARVFSQAI
ncbi:MAG: oxygen-independent coproporphyrinogen III oxidase [Leptospiraceae bacterium]|nr:oxygen-independent coproporphyrinogen III oxidase [Leptospiraceae bacterium]